MGNMCDGFAFVSHFSVLQSCIMMVLDHYCEVSLIEHAVLPSPGGASWQASEREGETLVGA